MRNYFALFILFFVVCSTEGDDQNDDVPSVRANKPRCTEPPGEIGDTFSQSCLKKTCTRKGRKAYWKESYASDDCCNFNANWFETGQPIKNVLSTDNCSIVNIICGRNKAANPEIMIDIRNHCPNVEDVLTLIKIHAGNTQSKIKNLSDLIEGSNQQLTANVGENIENLTGKIESNFQKLTENTEENSQKLTDEIDNIEQLLQIFHNDTVMHQWTIIQRRGQFGNKKDYFSNKLWDDYVNGFGNPSGELWLGLKTIAAMTSTGLWELRVDLEDYEGKQYSAFYSYFKLSNNGLYHLSISGYDAANSTIRDSLSFANGSAFSTSDNDNDAHASNCASNYKGAWWYTACHQSNLNGYNYFLSETGVYAKGIIWLVENSELEQGHFFSWPKVEMKIRNGM